VKLCKSGLSVVVMSEVEGWCHGSRRGGVMHDARWAGSAEAGRNGETRGENVSPRKNRVSSQAAKGKGVGGGRHWTSWRAKSDDGKLQLGLLERREWNYCTHARLRTFLN
jgi:hypothetical protein